MLSQVLSANIFKILSKKDKKIFFWLLFLMIFFGLVEAFTYSLVIPYLNVVIDPNRILSIQQLQPIIAYFNLQDPLSLVALISVIFLSLYTFKTIIQLMLQYWINKFPYDVARHNMKELYRHYLGLSYEFFLKKNHKHMMKVLTQSIPRLSLLLVAQLSFYSSLITSCCLIAILLSKQFLFSLIMLSVIGGVGVFLYYFFKSRQKQAGNDYENGTADFYKTGLESFQLIKEIKLFNKITYFQNVMGAVSDKITGSLKVSSFLSAVPGVLMEYVVILFLVGVVYVLMLFVNQPQVYGTLFIFYAIVGRRLLSCLGIMIASKSTIENLKPSLKVLYKELVNQDTDKAYDNDLEIQPVNSFDVISFDNISFSYNKKNDVLKSISLDIKCNNSIAFVGPSGSGKSTLLDLFLSFLSPDSGQFLVDGKPINSLEGLWPKIGYVPQMMTVLDDTLARNIAFGVDIIDEDKLNRVIKMAHLDDVLATLKLGVNTVLGDRGIQLSGGQQQRVAIARALYLEPDILVLDEATSSLDSVTEKHIANSIARMKGQLTIIVIAHRLSTVRDFDCIYVLDKGKLVGQGKHDSLETSNSIYKSLVALDKQ